MAAIFFLANLDLKQDISSEYVIVDFICMGLSTVDFGWLVGFESIYIFRDKIVWNCNFVGLLHHPF